MLSHLSWHVGAVVVVSGVLLGCAHSPSRAPAPAVANNGVALSVVPGQRCFVTRDDEKLPPPANDNRVHVRVAVRIDNDAPATVGVAPGQVRLTPHAPGPEAQAELAPIGSQEVSVPPGESRVVPIEFAGQGRGDCHQAFDLDPRDAVTIDNRQVVLAPVPLASAR